MRNNKSKYENLTLNVILLHYETKKRTHEIKNNNFMIVMHILI